MDLLQVIVPAAGIALLTSCQILAGWQSARATRAMTLSRMDRYGEPSLRMPPRLAAL
jgi:hypothetical protein